ncbi:MAG TPA: hypothetical protein VMT72_02525 [Pseudolabrys sp.]|nr:hypothetical protein [Pseudolabrys sp.]
MIPLPDLATTLIGDDVRRTEIVGGYVKYLAVAVTIPVMVTIVLQDGNRRVAEINGLLNRPAVDAVQGRGAARGGRRQSGGGFCHWPSLPTPCGPAHHTRC